MPHNHDPGASWTRTCSGCRMYQERLEALESERELREFVWTQRHNLLLGQLRDSQERAEIARLKAIPEGDEEREQIARLRAKIKDLQSALAKARRKGRNLEEEIEDVMQG